LTIGEERGEEFEKSPEFFSRSNKNWGIKTGDIIHIYLFFHKNWGKLRGNQQKGPVFIFGIYQLKKSEINFGKNWRKLFLFMNYPG